MEWTLKCLEAGKHVLCEKPIALQAGQIDALIKARDQTGLLAAEAFMVIHHPQWLQVRDWVQNGKIGALRHVEGAFTFFNDDKGNIRNQADKGGGALRDIGVYPSVTTRFVTNAEPVKIGAVIDWQNNVDTSARVQADFPGFSADFYVSMRMALRQSMVFHGERAVLSVHAPFNPRAYGQALIEIVHEDGRRESQSFQTADQYENQFNAFHESILNGAEYPCSLEFSRGNQRMIDMIFQGENR